MPKRGPETCRPSPGPQLTDYFGCSSNRISPCRRQPTRASQVRAEATGGGPIPFATGGTRHPANHAADEHGSIPVTSLRCFRKFIKVRARRRDERAANEWEHAGSAEAADGFHGPQRDVDRVRSDVGRPLPVSWRFQPVAAEEAAARAVELVVSGPHGRAPDVGGPEVMTLDEMTHIWRSRRGRPRRIVRIALPGRVARGFRLGLNTCPANASGGPRWVEHVARISG